MSKRLFLLSLVFLITFSLTACQPGNKTSIPTATQVSTIEPTLPPKSTATPTAEPVSQVDHIVISEVLGGRKGNNNYEFIELYNPTTAPLDLQGLSLWYQLAENQKPVRIARWTALSLIPGQGHYLLVRKGEDVGVQSDAIFDQGINLSRGAVALRNSKNELIDGLGWGPKAPPSSSEGSPAVVLSNGQSLERLPGGKEGNGQDTDDNKSDFVLSANPTPQNTGSNLTPFVEKRLLISAEAPKNVTPGSNFAYTITVTNHTGQAVHNVVASLLLPPQLSTDELPQDVMQEKNAVMWQLPMLTDGDSASVILPVTAPWTYFDAKLHSYTVLADDWPNATVGPTVVTRIEGGMIPIATARTLQNAQLTLEGVATMYTGGYYAGGGNTKFYVEDESGGIQVQVFSGEGVVNVHVGDKVRIKGTIGIYRGTIQIIPDIVPDDVQILSKADPNKLPDPTKVSIADALSKEDLLGRLIQIQGKITSVQEYSYSYSIDIADDQGNSINLYVDKRTPINPEAMEAGQLYWATGILEMRDGKVQLYPRLQSDLMQAFPPVLMVSADAPLTVRSGQPITYTASIFNYTESLMTHIVISARPPAGAKITTLSEGGAQTADGVQWTLPELKGNGARTDVFFIVTAPESNGPIIFDGFSATADQWTEPATSSALTAFSGDTVPIWAIQGEGDRSPYVLKRLTTEGVVTGFFPDLPGFFIQGIQTDDDPLTSEGLFINTSQLETVPLIKLGDVVRLTGQVRETSQQTQLQLQTLEDIKVENGNVELPTAVVLDPPDATIQAQPYFEALEGMLVAVPGEAWAVSPTSKYGEYVVVLPKHKVHRLWRGQDNGFAIMVDDGSSSVHTDSSTLPYAVTTGDTVKNIEGPLAFTYDRYKIEPIQPPIVEHASHPIPKVASLQPNQFTIMTWNAENVFDARPPNPEDPPLPTPKAYHLALKKMAATIADAGYPTIIGLEEIENIDVLKDLAQQDAIQDQAYQPVLIEGFDNRGVDVGYLVRGDAKILDVQQYDAPEGITSRPPLLLKVQIGSGNNAPVLYAIVNHFSSMSGGVEITEPRRNAQAKWNVHIIKDIILPQDPDAMIAVMGDLNSFLNSKPVQTLRDAGLKHALDFLPADQRYTYIFQGESQVLDHLLVTPNLYAMLKNVVILHVNADFPPPVPGDASPIRKSDHDPVIAVFQK